MQHPEVSLAVIIISVQAKCQNNNGILMITIFFQVIYPHLQKEQTREGFTPECKNVKTLM